MLFIFILFCQFMGDKQKENTYNREMQQFEHQLAQDKKRIQEEQKGIAYLKQELMQLDECSKRSQRVLQALYDKNVIFPKYRSFVMVASIYEYLCAGRCSTLEGHEGAYNILEMELRLNRIIGQLDQVIYLLDQIKNTQYMIYSAIQQSNQKLGELISSSQRMESNIRRIEAQGEELNSRIAGLQATSTLNLYFNELNNKELSYISRMDLL